jgi:hypothetical protein
VALVTNNREVALYVGQLHFQTEWIRFQNLEPRSPASKNEVSPTAAVSDEQAQEERVLGNRIDVVRLAHPKLNYLL